MSDRKRRTPEEMSQYEDEGSFGGYGEVDGIVFVDPEDSPAPEANFKKNKIVSAPERRKPQPIAPKWDYNKTWNPGPQIEEKRSNDSRNLPRFAEFFFMLLPLIVIGVIVYFVLGLYNLL